MSVSKTSRAPYGSFQCLHNRALRRGRNTCWDHLGHSDSLWFEILTRLRPHLNLTCTQLTKILAPARLALQ